MEGQIRLLIVEDEPEDCLAFQEYLKNIEEIDLIGQTDSACQALEQIKDNQPDAIILDLELEEGNGIDMLYNIRELSLPYEPYIVMTTNTTYQPTLQIARDHGVGYVCSKQKKNYGPADAIQMILRAKKYMHRKPSVPIKVQKDSYPRASGADKENVSHIKMELSYLGITSKTKGCRILIDAILEASHYDLQKLMVTKDLYPILAEKYEIPIHNVERNIRSAIESAWKRTSLEVLEKYCPELFHAAPNRPTNREFIQYYAEKIQNK